MGVMGLKFRSLCLQVHDSACWVVSQLLTGWSPELWDLLRVWVCVCSFSIYKFWLAIALLEVGMRRGEIYRFGLWSQVMALVQHRVMLCPWLSEVEQVSMPENCPSPQCLHVGWISTHSQNNFAWRIPGMSKERPQAWSCCQLPFKLHLKMDIIVSFFLFPLNVLVTVIWDSTILNCTFCLNGKCLLFSAPEARAEGTSVT